MLIIAIFVGAAVVAQYVATVMADLLAPGMSAAAELLLETVAVAIVLGITSWRLVYLPMSHRAATATPATSATSMPVETLRHRHLRLVD